MFGSEGRIIEEIFSKLKFLGNHKKCLRKMLQLLHLRDHSTTMWTEFCHFLTPILRGQYLYHESGQKQTFLTPFPPPLILST